MPTDGKLKISIKYEDIDLAVKISKEKSPDVYAKVMAVIKPTETEIEETNEYTEN